MLLDETFPVDSRRPRRWRYHTLALLLLLGAAVSLVTLRPGRSAAEPEQAIGAAPAEKDAAAEVSAHVRPKQQASGLRLTVKDFKSGQAIPAATAQLGGNNADPKAIPADRAGVIDLGTLREGDYQLTIAAPKYAAYRGAFHVPAARPAGEVRLKHLRTRVVTVEGDRAKWPKSGLVILVMQSHGHEHITKVGADGIARCEGLVDGPACLAAMGAMANEGSILWSARVTIDGDGQQKIALGECASVKGTVHVPAGIWFDAIFFMRADSGTIGGMCRSGQPSFTVALLPGKYKVYLRRRDDCYPLGTIDVKSGAAEPLDLTLDRAKMKNPLNQWVVLGLEAPDRSPTSTPAPAEPAHRDGGITEQTRAVATKPYDAMAHRNLGAALQKQGRFDEAIQQFRAALMIKPDCAEAQVGLGLALASMGRLDQAITCYRRAVEIKPDDAETRKALGNAFMARGRIDAEKEEWDKAIADLTSAIGANPNLAEAYWNRGVAFGKKDEKAKADEDFARAKTLGFKGK
jgi:hypothetical protein